VPEVIADTSPVQYLYQANVLHILPQLYGQVTIPEAVAYELGQGLARGTALPDPGQLPWMSVRQVLGQTLLPLVTNLGPGEREVLALAKEAPESLALLDDALARRYARFLGIGFTGTLGVLLKAKQSGYLPRVAPLLDRLESLRFRLDQGTRQAVPVIAGEAS
jgi:predicted nucleic acid-binding protein